MRVDPARTKTDKQLQKMETRLTKIYSQAREELTEKWNAYMARGQVRLANLYSAYQSAPANEKADALKKYQEAAQNYTLRNQWYREMVDITTYRLANVNQIAADYINGNIPDIYRTNYNYIDPNALLVKSSWNLVDEHMVRNLSLPYRQVNYGKDMAWNTRQINNAVLQGVLQGESMDDIAKRLLPIVDNNRKSAIRAARTMVTGAENRGRLDRYRDYEDEGLIMTKIWIATPDGRTRDWHINIDGQEVPVDDYFIDSHGNELEYPGDPGAEPETVYNCRCTMRSHITGVRSADGHVTKISNYRSGGSSGILGKIATAVVTESLHEKQIEAEKQRRRHSDDDDDDWED